MTTKENEKITYFYSYVDSKNNENENESYMQLPKIASKLPKIKLSLPRIEFILV